ncbi:MAG TPA: HEAT repeat domain-containing protein [Planctomycetota bacterium]|nr:HEAT repeat domain-containing protein [Planctomycetota bacterium]
MRRAVLLACVLLVVCAACADKEAQQKAAKEARLREAASLVARMDDPVAFEQAVRLGEIGPFVDATAEGKADETRCTACLVLGRIGSDAARARLEEVAKAGGRVGRCAYAGLRGMTPEEMRAVEGKEAEARPLIDRLDDEAVFARVVELGATGPLVDATADGKPERIRRLACLALGRIGGPEARDRLLAILAAPTPQARVQGAIRLYAAAGLTLLNDPGTAVDLILQLSAVNPNDNVAALAAEGVGAEYFTVDAQLCDALLGMGVWTIEDELVAQLRRHDMVRVLIDAYAVLRRRTGIDLPFRYNGSYADREADADAWAKRLKETRAERVREHPFDARNPRFRARCADMIAWLGGMSVNDRYIAEKVFARLGPPAVPQLAEAVLSGAPSLQREAALALGRIGDPAAAPALREALALADPKARARALEALRAVGDADAIPLAAKHLGDPDAEVRANAARLLGGTGDKGHVDRLRAALAKEAAPATIVQLACALSRLGDPAQVSRLLSILVEGEQLDRQAAYDELSRLEPGWKADPLAPKEDRAKAAAGFPRK